MHLVSSYIIIIIIIVIIIMIMIMIMIMIIVVIIIIIMIRGLLSDRMAGKTRNSPRVLAWTLSLRFGVRYGNSSVGSCT